jgi:hypothetical protein
MELAKYFQLVAGSSNKILPHQLVKLSKEAGDPVSLDEAKAMMSNSEWTRADFERVLSPSRTSKK